MNDFVRNVFSDTALFTITATLVATTSTLATLLTFVRQRKVVDSRYAALRLEWKQLQQLETTIQATTENLTDIHWRLHVDSSDPWRAERAVHLSRLAGELAEELTVARVKIRALQDVMTREFDVTGRTSPSPPNHPPR